MSPPALDRRSILATLLGSAAGLAGLPLATDAQAAERWPEHELMDLRVSGSPQLGRRATVWVPKVSRGAPLPVLVLLHGLGETGNERDGAYAWAERYGLTSSYQRLLHPPVERGVRRMRYLLAPRAEAVNRELALRPFRGMILVCPYTPNVFKMNTAKALDEYAAWLVEVLLPEVRARTPARTGARWTGLDGCSLGGFISYQVFQRRPEAFFTCGGVQAAIGKGVAVQYADRIREIVQRVGPRRIHVETSSQDPYHDANVAFARQLARRGLEHQLRVSPGPHNQPWLIEAGTLEMLLWHDRQFW
jgi:iron(III)-salmochelin esterase